MNVHEMTQSFQSMVESIATTNPTEHYVSKDLFQNCMASVANNIIELVQSVNQLTWGLNTGVQTLSDKLENSEKATQILHANDAKMSERIDKWDSNNTKVCNIIKELSNRIENMNTTNSQNITMLSNKLHKFEENNSSIKENIKDISDRLQIAELNSISLNKTTEALSEKVNQVCESVDNLHKSSATIMSNYQNQQTSIESLTNNFTSLQEKSAQVISHSTAKPPPGLPHRNISHTPFFTPKPPPGFHTFMPLQRAIGLSPANLCLQNNQSGTITSGEFSPVLSNSITDTDLFEEVPVSQTDRDGNADLPQVSATPTKSFTVCLSNSVSTEESMSPS